LATDTLKVLQLGFEPLDVYGPLEILYALSDTYNMTLATISHVAGPISARPPLNNTMLGPSTIATHTFSTAPPLDVIIVPGGGQRYLDVTNDTAIEDFVRSRYESTSYILSVCTGAAALAKSGILAGKRATTSKAEWEWVTKVKNSEEIKWQPNARWTQDGKVWTSSGVAAGMDMMYAFLTHVYGDKKVDSVMNMIEYAPHTDPHWDPFSVVHNVS
jgi:putative intracellular protease/amidase